MIDVTNGIKSGYARVKAESSDGSPFSAAFVGDNSSSNPEYADNIQNIDQLVPIGEGAVSSILLKSENGATVVLTVDISLEAGSLKAGLPEGHDDSAMEPFHQESLSLSEANPGPSNSRDRSPFIVVLIVLLVLGAIGGVWYYYKSEGKNVSPRKYASTNVASSIHGRIGRPSASCGSPSSNRPAPSMCGAATSGRPTPSIRGARGTAPARGYATKKNYL
jgi:hypothetical protein